MVRLATLCVTVLFRNVVEFRISAFPGTSLCFARVGGAGVNLVNMRTFETRVTLGLSVHDYTKLRMDLAFGEFCANMENQILEVQLHETDDGTVHRSMSKKFKESPVPPLLRGLAGAIGVTPAHMQFTLEERFNPERFSSTSPMKVSSRLPGSFAELVFIESQQWVESIEDGQRCVLCAQHEVTANLMGGRTIERQIESRIRTSYDMIPHQVAAYVAERAEAASGALAPTLQASATPGGGGEDGVVAVDVRRRVSIVMEDGGRADGDRLGSFRSSFRSGDLEAPPSTIGGGARGRTLSITATAGNHVRTLSTVNVDDDDDDDGNRWLTRPLPDAAAADEPASAPSSLAAAKPTSTDPSLQGPLESASPIWQHLAQLRDHMVRCLPPLSVCLSPTPTGSPALDVRRPPRTKHPHVLMPPSITPRVADFHDVQGHVVYRIVTLASTADGSYEIPTYRRYSDFVKLHAELRRLGGLPLPSTFPVPKRLFHPTRALEKRQHQLQAYLAQCSSRVVDATVPSASLATLCRFLDLEGALIGRARMLYYSQTHGYVTSGGLPPSGIPSIPGAPVGVTNNAKNAQRGNANAPPQPLV